MYKIQTITAGSAVASLDFTVPSGYDDLYLVVSVRGDATGPLSDYLRINNLTSGYSTRYLQGNGSSAASGTDPGGTTWAWLGTIPGTGATSNTFASQAIYLPNYTSTSAKSWSVEQVMENNATTSYQSISAHLNSTTNQISAVSVHCDGGNFVQGSTATLYGIKNAASGAPKATGGTRVWTDGTYWYHQFQASGTFTALQSLSNVDYLVIAGGGGGGSYWGAGGGAGGYRCSVTGESSGGGASSESKLNLSAGAYTVTIGAGGAAGQTSAETVSRGTSGNNSVFGSITSTGGGGGGGVNNSVDTGSATGRNGGSGGGAGVASTSPGSPGTGTTGQGYAGGNGAYTGAEQISGGGGGAGAVGGNAGGSTTGAGGNGVSSAITGTSVTRAGGGAGGGRFDRGASGGSAGSGGGGTWGSAGTVNTGSGGGGGLYNSGVGSAGAGGSGIVIVRYAA